nr:hypothetical protein [Paraburkholderia terrae]
MSMDRQEVVWPEIDEDINVPALLAFQSEIVAHLRDSPDGDFSASPPST